MSAIRLVPDIRRKVVPATLGQCDGAHMPRVKEVAMKGETKERWMELCALAAVEQDPLKLMELVEEINDLLEEKERRLGLTPPHRDVGADGSGPSWEN